MSVLKSRLNEILNANFNQSSSSKYNLTESSQTNGYKTKQNNSNDLFTQSFKAFQSKPKKSKFDLSKSLTELGLQQPTNTRQYQGLFTNEDPTLKTLTTTTSSYLDNTVKRNQRDASSSYNNFSFSIAKSQLKNMHLNSNNNSINNSFTFTRSNSKTHSRIQKQIEDINKTLSNKPQIKGGNLHKPTFTEVNIDQKEYLSISPFNLRKGILNKATHTVVSPLGQSKGRNSNININGRSNNNNNNQSHSIFDLLLTKDKQGKIPLMNRKYMFEKQNADAEDFFSGLVNGNSKEKSPHNPILTTESNYLTRNIGKINKRSLSQQIVFNF